MLFTTDEFVAAFFAKWKDDGSMRKPISTEYAAAMSYPLAAVSPGMKKRSLDAMVDGAIDIVQRAQINAKLINFSVTDEACAGAGADDTHTRHTTWIVMKDSRDSSFMKAKM